MDKFEITSGKMVLSDPCYSLDTWCMGTADVRNGTWKAHVDYAERETRIASLTVYHEEYGYVSSDSVLSKGEKMPFECGVDSGQFGFFDMNKYRNDSEYENVKRVGGERICEDEPFYSICCDRTLSDKSWGVIPYGAVSSSGWGDGGYDAYGIKDKDGKYVAFTIVYIFDDEDDEDEW